jgi:hypothetical protein
MANRIGLPRESVGSMLPKVVESFDQTGRVRVDCFPITNLRRDFQPEVSIHLL